MPWASDREPATTRRRGAGTDAGLTVARVQLEPLRGRWLSLAVVNGGPATTAVLRLASGSSDWPDMDCRCPLPAGTSRLPVFVGAGLDRLTLVASPDAAAVLRLDGVQPAERPRRGAGVPPLMTVLDRLHGLKVVRLVDVRVHDDAGTPLEALSAAAEVWLAQPLGNGRQRLAVTLPWAGAQPSPRLVLVGGGKGGEEGVAVALAHEDHGVFAAEAPVPARCQLQRLLPLGRAGRFDLHGFTHLPLAGTGGAVRRADRALSALERATGLWTLRSVGAEVGVVAGSRPWQGQAHYVATGDDPQLHLDGRLPAGWYMWELALTTHHPASPACLYWDEGQGMSERHAALLFARAGQLSKRLVRLTAPSRVRFDPVSGAGGFVVSHFRLRRLGSGFAEARLQAKLKQNHPRYRGSPPPGPDGQPGVERRTRDAEQCWRDYDSLFQSERPQLGYADWIALVEAPARLDAAQRAEQASWARRPGFSLLLDLNGATPPTLGRSLSALLAQSWPEWELCVATGPQHAAPVLAMLAEVAAREPRLRLLALPQGLAPAAAANAALAAAQGDFVAVLRPGDVLAPHALHAVAKALQAAPGSAPGFVPGLAPGAAPGVTLFYGDHDSLDAHGERARPFFKPDFCREQFLCQDYLQPFAGYRRAAVQALGGFDEASGPAYAYALALRLTAGLGEAELLHVAEVLVHVGAGSTTPLDPEPALRAVAADLARDGRGATVSAHAPGIRRVRWPLPPEPPLVSLIVPTRDKLELIRNCVESILERSDYRRFEILIVDNQSSQPATLAWFDAIAAHPQVRVLRYEQPFNYSAINNFAAAEARGSVLGLINNDVEVITPGWLGEMVSLALRPEVGCVGAMLLYPNDTIQHAGVVMGLGGCAGHSHKHQRAGTPGYHDRLRTVHRVSAVTGAVLLVRKALFDAVGGLDAEHLVVAFNDVDLCLKIEALGHANLFTPHAVLYHHESISRGVEDTPEKLRRFAGEVHTMRTRWAEVIRHDRWYNPNLTRLREDFTPGEPACLLPAVKP